MAGVVLCIIFAPGFSSQGMRLAKIPPYERFHGPIRDCFGERLSLADDSAFFTRRSSGRAARWICRRMLDALPPPSAL